MLQVYSSSALKEEFVPSLEKSGVTQMQDITIHENQSAQEIQ